MLRQPVVREARGAVGAARDVVAEQHEFGRVVDGAGARHEQPAVEVVELEGRRAAHAGRARILVLRKRAAVEAGDRLRAARVDGDRAEGAAEVRLHVGPLQHLELHALAVGAGVEVVHDQQPALAVLLRVRGLGAQVAEGELEESLPVPGGARRQQRAEQEAARRARASSRAPVVGPDRPGRAAVRGFAALVQQAQQPRALVDQRGQLLVAARDRGGIAADFRGQLGDALTYIHLSRLISLRSP